MKKLLSVFLALLVFISAFTISCFADNSVKLTLNSETDTVYAGDEFVVKLMISDNSKMSGAAIDVNYDKDKLEYVSGTFGGILDSSATKSLKNLNSSKAKVRFTYLAPSSSVTSQGVLVTLKFKALDDAVGNTQLTVSVPNPGDFVSQDLSRLSYSVENAKIEIINNVTATESVSETETESETIESATQKETTTKPIQSVDDSDDEDIDKTILVVIVSGIAILLVVALLNRKPKSKSKKKKRKK